MKLDRKQDLNVLYQVCVFRADRKNKMAALASDWLRHFRLLLWNRWTKFKETWQEARSQRPLPSLCFSGQSEKQDGRPGLWLAETFSTSPLKTLNGIQRNLTGSKISTSSTILLPVKFPWIPFSGFRGEVENVSANQRPGRPSCFSDRPEKHKLGKVHSDLPFCKVSSNSVQWFQRRSQKCEKLTTTDGRTDDGRTTDGRRTTHDHNSALEPSAQVH